MSTFYLLPLRAWRLRRDKSVAMGSTILVEVIMFEHPSFVFARGVGRAMGAILLVMACMGFMEVFGGKKPAEVKRLGVERRMSLPLALLSIGILLWGL